MKKAKLLVTSAVIAAMSVTTFAGCGNSEGQGTSNQGDSTTATEAAANDAQAAEAGGGSVYMLNFKPEVDQQMPGYCQCLYRTDRCSCNYCYSSIRYL